MRALMMLFLILLFSQQAAAEETPQQGRYQIIFGQHVRADTFLLDTWTGKIWQKTKFVDMENEPLVWDVMDRIDGREDYLEWRKHHLSKKEAAAFKEPPKAADAFENPPKESSWRSPSLLLNLVPEERQDDNHN